MNNPWWYTIYNPLIWIICFFISYKNYITYQRVGNVFHRNKTHTIMILFLLFFLTTMFTLRSGDDLRYREFVETLSFYYGERNFDAFEYYYYIVAELVNHNYYYWKIVVYVPALILVYVSIIRLNVNTFSTYMAFAIFCLPSYGATRGVLAYSLFLFGYSFLAKFHLKTLFLAFFIIISTRLAHSSMVLPIVLTPLVFFKLNKKRIWLLVALFPVIVYAFNNIYPMLYTNDYFMEEQYGNKFNTYTDADKNAGAHYFSSILSTINGIYGIIAVFVMLLYSMMLDINKKLPPQISKLIHISFYIFYIALVIVFSNMIGKVAISMRYFMMIPFFLFVVWPYFLSETNICTPRNHEALFKKEVFLSFKKQRFVIFFSLGYLLLKAFICFYYSSSK